MWNDVSGLIASEFSKARLKSFLARIASLVSGRPRELLSYEDVKASLHIGGPVYRGLQMVPLNAIVGTLNRYHDFDRAFYPTQDETAGRWENVARAFYQHKGLPPVVLYKVGQVYFVVDGHHRVSVAREQGLDAIEAEVRECETKVNITPDIAPEDLRILGAKVDFLERTHLDRLRPKAKIRLTIVGGFDRMLEHIAVHRYFMGSEQGRAIPEEEAVTHWYDTVYLPIVQIIRDSQVLKEFPGRTEADLYIWVLDHQQNLARAGAGELNSPEEAARRFLEDRD